MTEDQDTNNFEFQAEVQQLLNLVVHSLYSDREVFVRELISNASDAYGRLRFESMTDSSMREGEIEESIDIEVNKRARKITFYDRGIGMTQDEVISNIGTIARSGTKRFVEALSGEQSLDSRLIGQFGVGFYSIFMVAENVTVTTRKAGKPADTGTVWTSDGVTGFTIQNETVDQHGTTITLELRKDAKEFLDDLVVADVVKKYSDHVSIPIRVKATGTKQEKEWVTANNASALWTRPRKDITEEEYNNFYKTLSLDYEDPLIRMHNRVEGRLEYSSLLFIPSRAPFDLFDREHRHGIRLYVRRIFIMDNTDALMPAYLRFVKGIVDSDDLPLNVSREFLQQNKQIEKIKSGTVRKVLGELKRVANKDSEKYQQFWDQFGKVLKEGMFEDEPNKDALSELLRFSTTKGEGAKQSISLAQYVERMPEKQEVIYYITGDSYSTATSSPHLEVFRKHDIEVLLLTDPVDEWVVSYLHKYADKELKSITKGELSLDNLKSDEEETTPEKEPVKVDSATNELIEKLKQSLSERVQDVRVSTRLTDSPSCIVVHDHEMGNHLRRMMEAAGQAAPRLQPVLEINPDHPLIKTLVEKDEGLEDWANVLFDNAMLSEGSALEDPADYVKRITTLLTGSAGAETSRIITL